MYIVLGWLGGGLVADLDGRRRVSSVVFCTVYHTIRGEIGRERLGSCSGRPTLARQGWHGSKKVYQLVSMLLELAGVDLVSSVKSGGLRSPRIWFRREELRAPPLIPEIVPPSISYPSLSHPVSSCACL